MSKPSVSKSKDKAKDIAPFDFSEIEAKYVDIWGENGLYEVDYQSAVKPFYNLMMFPYPSAEGLHVGNMYAFCGSDIYGRYQRMRGNDVLEPIGLDGFGIHSENYAMKIGEHPVDVAKRTEANFYRQLRMIGNGFSWQSKLETYDPAYYKWTQWVFVQLFKAGLAYRGEGEVNWCPSCLTVLADEQVIKKSAEAEVNVCERCGTEVVKKKLTQWYFKITTYAQRLLDGLEEIDWTEKVKIAQRNWIGKSEGAEVVFQIDIEKTYSVRIFTTRVDTLFGVTFLALASDHSLVTTILNHAKGPEAQAIRQFLEQSKERLATKGNIRVQEDKNGVFTGVYATNPVNGEKVPVYIADYVLTGYGTGAVMGVPAHDERDFEFAKKYNLEIKQVIEGLDTKADISREAFTQKGKLVNSNEYDGIASIEAMSKLTADLEKKGKGKKAVNWHLRDWIISRQRYWGPPIPMIYCAKCASQDKSWFTTDEGSKGKNVDEGWNCAGWYPVEEKDLPVELPYLENFKPKGSGDSPLAQDQKFVNVKCPECGADAKRETDVSDTFLDSSWYFLRYPSVANADEPWSEEITKKWLPVEMYIGGAEHSVLHLLYSRFITKVFFDLGLVEFEEPFEKFRAHGLLIKDGAKMSKSKGNVVNPDDYIAKYGADTLRAYLMFCGRYSEGGDFRDEGIEGMHRFLKRVWRIVVGSKAGPAGLDPAPTSSLKVQGDEESSLLGSAAGARAGTPRPSPALDNQSLFMMNKTVKKVTEDIENLSYNTAIASVMEWMNFLESSESLSGEEIETLLKLLAPFAPFMTEDLWQMKNGQGNSGSIHVESWPKFDIKLATSEKATIVVQIDGKLRERLVVERGLGVDEIRKMALESDNVSKYITSGSDSKVIFVEDKLINFVTASAKN